MMSAEIKTNIRNKTKIRTIWCLLFFKNYFTGNLKYFVLVLFRVNAIAKSF